MKISKNIKMKLEQVHRGSHIPPPVPPPNESKGLTQNFDVKVDKLKGSTHERTNRQCDKNYIPPDSMSGYYYTLLTSHFFMLTGIISEVDEDSAYSWEACNFCNSDQLVSQTTESGDNPG